MLDIERVEGGNRAILVHMDIHDEAHRENLSEFKELVVSSGAQIMTITTTSRQKADPDILSVAVKQKKLLSW